MSQNAVIPAANPSLALRQFLSAETVSRELARVLPKHLTPDRVIRQTLTLCNKTPKLLTCSSVSILGGLIQAAELGLELSGVLGQAYLVPRWNSSSRCTEAHFQVGYRGLIDLAFRSGKVTSFPLRIVYDRDEFEIEYGSYQRIFHKPYRGEEETTPVGYYAMANLVSGGTDFEFMTVRQVEQHRDRYSKGADSSSSPWVTAFSEMALKTPCRKLAKRLPLSVEFVHAAVLDEYNEAGVGSARPELNPSARTEALAGLLDAPSGEPAGVDPEADAG